MSDSNAAGRKTEKLVQQPSGFTNYVDALLGMATEGMREAMHRADQATGGYLRPEETGHAIRYGTLGAQLLTALAKAEAKREK